MVGFNHAHLLTSPPLSSLYVSYVVLSVHFSPADTTWRVRWPRRNAGASGWEECTWAKRPSEFPPGPARLPKASLFLLVRERDALPRSSRLPAHLSLFLVSGCCRVWKAGENEFVWLYSGVFIAVDIRHDWLRYCFGGDVEFEVWCTRSFYLEYQVHLTCCQYGHTKQ